MAWYHRLISIVRSNRVSTEIQREVDFHLAERADDLRRFGFSEREARYEARRRFGNQALLREHTRAADIATWLDSAVGDIRYGLRALRRSPIVSLVAVGSIALGIGATTAIYSLIDVVSLRPLPVAHPEELMQVGTVSAGKGGLVDLSESEQYFSNPLWEQLRDRPNGFTAVTAFSTPRFNVTSGGQARFASGIIASGDYFRVFGVTPALGRLFDRRDDVRGCPGVAVISGSYWEQEFGRREDVIGRTLSLDGVPFQIIGVASHGFAGPDVGRASQVIVPLCTDQLLRGERHGLDERTQWWLRVIGRRPGDVDPRAVAARLASLAPAAYGATIPPIGGAERQREYVTRTFGVADFAKGSSSLRTGYQRALVTLMAFVSLVLLIACVNVANLLLARAAARQREVAIRLAIGADRSRLVRQLLTESILLAAIGAMGGLLIAHWGASALVGMISTPQRTVALDLSLSPRILAFTAGVTALTVAIFGAIPAWRATRVTLQSAMKTMGHGVTDGHARFTLGKALVSAQVALSLVLLVGAGLLVGSLRKLSNVDLGFRADGVLIVEADLRRLGIPRENLAPVRDAVLAAIRTIPGIVSASRSSVIPFSGGSWNDELVVDGYTPKGPKDGLVWFNRVSDGYFTTMQMRLLLGRDFNPGDVTTAPRVAIVNEMVVHKFFGGANPIGRQLRTRMGDSASAPITVVGVVQDSKYRSLREKPSAIVFVAMSQQGEGPAGVTVQVRAPGDPADLVPAVKTAVARVNPKINVDIRTLSGLLTSSISRERLMARLSGMFGALALALAMLGLYGIMSYAVTRRRKEIGVRVAIGANRARIIRMVLADVTRVVIVGCAIGFVVAAASGKLVASLLYDMKPDEPLVLWGSAATLIVVALLAGLIPALNASRVDPMATLREE